ncbi:hypothetical protein ACWGH2_09910 [Streptomyces sp. NPDC054871]
MTEFQCESCSYESDDPEEFQRHLQETGHVGIRKDEAAPAGNKLTKVLLVTQVLTVAALGATVWACKLLYARAAELEAENKYLKSPSGAGANLKSHHKP